MKMDESVQKVSRSPQVKNKVSKYSIREADNCEDVVEKLYSSIFASLRSTTLKTKELKKLR